MSAFQHLLTRLFWISSLGYSYQLNYENGVLSVERDDARLEAAVELCGDYVLKTDHSLTGPELWKLYMTLLRAEEGFSALKGALGLRPNFHQLEGRVEGLIFISVLAYQLLCWVGYQLTQSGDARDWQTVRRLLRTHALGSIESRPARPGNS